MEAKLQNGYQEAKVLNNWKCRLSMSRQVDTQAHSIASTFTQSQVDRSELQLNIRYLCLCVSNNLQLLTKNVGLI